MLPAPILWISVPLFFKIPQGTLKMSSCLPVWDSTPPGRDRYTHARQMDHFLPFPEYALGTQQMLVEQTGKDSWFGGRQSIRWLQRGEPMLTGYIPAVSRWGLGIVFLVLSPGSNKQIAFHFHRERRRAQLASFPLVLFGFSHKHTLRHWTPDPGRGCCLNSGYVSQIWFFKIISWLFDGTSLNFKAPSLSLSNCSS